MRTRTWIWALKGLVLIWAGPIMANGLLLTPEGVMLGRVSVSELGSDLTLTVDLAGDVPRDTHVMARFQNNRAQQRSEDGTWVFWNETTATLIDNGFKTNADGTLTFDLISTDLSETFLPITFTVAYRTEEELKSGYVVIDR